MKRKIPLLFLSCILALTLVTWSCDRTTPVNGDQEEEEELVGEQEEEENESVDEEEELKVHFIDVGEGDCILIDLGDTEVLIDGGDKSPGVVSYLSDYIDGALEVMVATHPHADHIGGLIAVLDTYEVQEIWLNGDSSTSQTYAEFMNRVNSEGAGVHMARLHDTIQAGELSLYVLHPADLSGSTNNNSIVLHLAYGDIDFLFTGDAEQEAEGEMMALSSVPLAEVEILKVGHHGSRTASRSDFLAITSPEVAIYMAGEGNSYGHPHEETITALSSVGAEIYGTDVHGTIVITTDGEEYSIELEKEGPPITPSVSSSEEPIDLPVSTPASFTITNLSVSPAEVEQEEIVTISASVTNTGGSTGTYAIVLKVNGLVTSTKSVTLAAGESQVVSFTVFSSYSGNYTVDVNGLEGSFAVIESEAQEQELFLEIVSVTSPIGQGYTATLQARTTPGAYCTITVYYKSGPSSASGLYPKTADSNGNVSWSWKVGTRTTPGSWQIVVTASFGGETVSETTYFTVY